LIYSTEDKKIEFTRYNERAKKLLLLKDTFNFDELGALSYPEIFKKPYIEYEKFHKKYIKGSYTVLEIGAGTGLFTKSLLDCGAKVVATDISPKSLEVIKKRFVKYQQKLIVQVADMEKLPFNKNYFDIVTCAGSLSYGDNDLVMNEIFRVLKPGGVFICVDSLNENPFYKFNRWLNYKRGRRSLGTLVNMPTISLIEKYNTNFELISINFFGSLVWIYPILKIFIGKSNATKIIDKFDNLNKTRSSAFKFVMAARKKI
jgi:SAM-dependent methyltransferase|tara:strand:- start:385 stop:1161 length:777 start_codon:yes stop_codon:yes gene_type:complete